MTLVRGQGSWGRPQGTWPGRRITIIQAGVAQAILAVVALPHGYPVRAAPPVTVGVVDFYVSGPTPAISGLNPGGFAADDLAQLLPKVAPHPVEVIPRGVLRKAEASMKWRSADVANPDRPAELAHRVGAAHLIIGRIERLYMTGGGGAMRGSPVQITAKIRIQVFDPPHRRFAPGASGEGNAVGNVQRVAAQQALQRANAAALPLALANAAPGR